MKSKSRFFIILLALIGLFAAVVFLAARSVTQAEAQSEGSVEASTGTIVGKQISFQMSPDLSEPSPEQLTRMREAAEGSPKVMPELPVGDTAVQRSDSVVDPGSATLPPEAASSAQPQDPSAPGDWRIYRNTYLGATIKAHTSRVGETTVVNSANVVFETGNWFGAISRDGGQNFLFVNPVTQFPNSWGGFCCDQVAVYDASHDLFIWYLQYISASISGQNKNIFRIAVSHPEDAVKGNWCYYDFASAHNTEWDYPDVAVSNDFLWVTTNRGPFQGTFVNDAWMFKFPLDPMSTCAALSYNFLDLGANSLTNLSLKMTRGATETMYFGSHNTTSQVRVYRWAENSGTISWNNVNLSAAWFTTTHNCPAPDGYNWCGFDDGRMKASWVARGLIGFMWGSAQGGSFTYPYVEAVRVRESDRSYHSRPYIWAGSGAFAYPAAAPNRRGDLGVAFFFGGGSYYPYFGLGIDDDVSRDAGYPPPGWNVYYLVQGNHAANNNRWGDYISVLPFEPTGLGWTAAGFTMQGCAANFCAEPRYVIFGRERDLRSVTKYYNPYYNVMLPLMYR